jgi:hypothetical protein
MTSVMDRRAFISGATLALLAAPPAAAAQPAGKVYRVGVLTNVPPSTPAVSRNWEAFRQGLRERGWVEGQNIVIEYRYAEGRVERFPSLAAELVSLKPDLLVALPNAGVRAAKRTTNTIPIVMVYVFAIARSRASSIPTVAAKVLRSLNRFGAMVLLPGEAGVVLAAHAPRLRSGSGTCSLTPFVYPDFTQELEGEPRTVVMCLDSMLDRQRGPSSEWPGREA